MSIRRSIWFAGFSLAIAAHAQQYPSQSQPPPSVPPPMKIAVIDFYGYGKLPLDSLRAAMTVRAGDTFSTNVKPQFIDDSVAKLERVPGVTDAHLDFVCCDRGGMLVYVGVRTADTREPRYRAAPTGAIRLDADVMQARRAFGDALQSAVRSGVTAEDRTHGHAIPSDPAMRAAVDRFIVFARRDAQKLRSVLRESADAEHRATAAQVLAYVDDKQSVVADLAYAVGDPSELVRNDATRALLVFAQADPKVMKNVLEVPFEPFVDMLGSPVWSDRNKSSGALDGLSKGRDRELLAVLKARAMEPLVEMARWQSEGHAMAAALILGRIAGLPDDETKRLLHEDQRDAIIAAAQAAK